MASDRLLYAFELHDPVLIAEVLSAGVDPNAPIKGRPPLMWLIEMYTRSPRFADCLRAMRDGGTNTGDPLVFAVLCDDTEAMTGDFSRRIDLDCAYTSLRGATLLHLCAEYNSVRCARRLLKAGMDVDTPAAMQPDGTGGHTAIFHTVNSNRNHSRPMLELLLDAGASLDIRATVAWGRGFDWETTVFDVTPISYAQCGLYPQFHRNPAAIYGNIDLMYRHEHGKPAPVRNVPNKYLGS